MNSLPRRASIVFVVVGATFLVPALASAHFLWLKSHAPNGKPEAVLIFGESAADEAYHLPEALADTQIWCRSPQSERAQLKTTKVETDDRVGLTAPLPDANTPQVLEATREYGVYGEFLLTYFAKHILADSNDELTAAGPSPELKFDVVPKTNGDGTPANAPLGRQTQGRRGG